MCFATTNKPKSASSGKHAKIFLNPCFTQSVSLRYIWTEFGCNILICLDHTDWSLIWFFLCSHALLLQSVRVLLQRMRMTIVLTREDDSDNLLTFKSPHIFPLQWCFSYQFTSTFMKWRYWSAWYWYFLSYIILELKNELGSPTSIIVRHFRSVCTGMFNYFSRRLLLSSASIYLSAWAVHLYSYWDTHARLHLTTACCIPLDCTFYQQYGLQWWFSSRNLLLCNSHRVHFMEKLSHLCRGYSISISERFTI